MKKNLFILMLALLGIVREGQSQTIYSENFEGVTIPSLPSGYTNTVTGTGLGWQTTSGITTFFSSIAIPAHTKYALVNEYTHPANYPAKVTTTSFSLSGSSHAYLSYDIWFGGYILTATGRREQAWVELSTDGGSTYSTIDTFTASTSGWTTKVVALSTTSSTCKLRFVYTDNRTSSTDTVAIIGCGLDNIRVFEAIPNDIAITAVTPVAGDPATDYAVVGGTVTFGGTAYNNGYNTITSFTATYNVPSLGSASSTISATIPPFSSYNFTITTPCTITSVGAHGSFVSVYLSSDTTRSNDTMYTQVNGVSFMPAKKILYEEATGTWGGFNVRGIVFMDSLWYLDSSSVSIASVHNSDPMQAENALTTSYDTYVSGRISGYPSIIIDRKLVDDPSQAFAIYAARHNYFGFANIAATTSFSSSALTVNCTVNPAINLSGDYRLELILTEDNVHGTASGYNQRNYYNGGSYGAMSFGSLNFVTLPSIIPAASMYYDFVARYSIPNINTTPNGVAGSLPSSMTAGSTYSYSFSSVSIPSTWSATNMRAIILLIDNNTSSPTYGQVLNSINRSIMGTPTISGVSTLCAGNLTTFTASYSGGTWSSSNPSVATVFGAGIVRAITAGTTVISYTTSAGTATATLVVNPATFAGTISGPTSLCPGATATYSSSVSGGTWASSNPSVATILGSGFAQALSLGTTLIMYVVADSCGIDTAFLMLNVDTVASAGTISGAYGVCVGSSTTFTDAIIGGTWSSSNPSIASVNPSTGVVYGISTGTATITYSVSFTCGSAFATHSITVNSGPSAGTISGASTVCVGASTTFTPTIAGGTWSSSNTAVASVSTGGVVSGMAMGAATISYAVNNGCGLAYATQSITVSTVPGVDSIVGADTICAGDTTRFINATAGGTWASSNTAIATVNASTGLIKGLIAGSVAITYTVTNSCGSNYTIHNLFVSTTGICHLGVTAAVVNTPALSVYPNPTSGVITVDMPGINGKATITIEDIYGKTIEVKNISNTTGLKERFNLAKGTYFVKVDSDGATYREKVIVW